VSGRSTWPIRTWDEYLAQSEAYFSVVREAGDLPWFEDPERSATMASRLGLATDTPALELRRALFEKGRSR
jgi:hypothetical protein